MTIHEQQHAFCQDEARLMKYATKRCAHYSKTEGRRYLISNGEAWRSEHEARRLAAVGLGIVKTLHRSRLAKDLNFKRETRPGSGRYEIVPSDHRIYRDCGRYWKRLRPVNRWGGSKRVFPGVGDFTRKHDPGHFSSTRGGVM